MKKILLIFLALSIQNILLAQKKYSFRGHTEGKTPTSQLKSYSYSKYGSSAEPLCDFTVEYVDDSNCKVIFYNRLGNGFAEDRDTITQPASLLKDIEAIVSEHKMYNYKKSYTSEFDVCDGYSWSLEMKYMDSTYVYSCGSNAGPKDQGIKIILEKIRKQIKGL